MKTRLPLSGIIIGLLLLQSTAAAAASSAGYNACRDAVDWLGWKAQREYRAALFGQKKARDAGKMEVRFAKDKSIWIKLAPPSPPASSSSSSSSTSSVVVDEWRSLSDGYLSTTWYNPLIDSQSDLPPRTGIFETRRRLSTELVPYIAQAYRSFDCRLDEICRLLELSDTVADTTPQNVTVTILGCNSVETKTIVECHLPSNHQTNVTQGELRSYCRTMTDALRTREIALTKEIVEYDAGYRSLLQLSGIMRGFLESMRGTVLGSLRSAASLLTTFSRMPCFIGACDSGSPASARH